jgi:hypothetical protein
MEYHSRRKTGFVSLPPIYFRRWTGAVSVSCRLVGFYDGLVTIQGMSRAILLAMDGPSDGQNIFYEINL